MLRAFRSMDLIYAIRKRVFKVEPRESYPFAKADEGSLCVFPMYRITSNYWNTITPYHICPKI